MSTDKILAEGLKVLFAHVNSKAWPLSITVFPCYVTVQLKAFENNLSV